MRSTMIALDCGPRTTRVLCRGRKSPQSRNVTRSIRDKERDSSRLSLSLSPSLIAGQFLASARLGSGKKRRASARTRDSSSALHPRAARLLQKRLSPPIASNVSVRAIRATRQREREREREDETNRATRRSNRTRRASPSRELAARDDTQACFEFLHSTPPT